MPLLRVQSAHVDPYMRVVHASILRLLKLLLLLLLLLLMGIVLML